MEGFRHDAHPMGMFISTVGALSTFYPDAKEIFSQESRRLQTLRLIARSRASPPTPTAIRFGRPFNLPDNELPYAGNFLNPAVPDDRASSPRPCQRNRNRWKSASVTGSISLRRRFSV